MPRNPRRIMAYHQTEHCMPSKQTPGPSHRAKSLPLLDRDQSLLDFNRRVLSWAERQDVPLLERLRFLCIVSSNLDEFFEVRAGLHLSAAQAHDHSGTFSAASFERLAGLLHATVQRQYQVYNHQLLPALTAQGLRLLSHGERAPAQRVWVQQYFEREVRPMLVPVGLDPSHPFPQVANKSLNFIVRLGGHDAFGRENEIAIVRVPRALPRVIRLPQRLTGDYSGFVLLSSVIRAELASLFPGRKLLEFSQFRVTRNSDLAVDENDVDNLRTALREGLVHRNFGQAVRLEVSAECSKTLSEFLLRQFDLPASACYHASGPVNLVRLSQLIDLAQRPGLCFPAYQPNPVHTSAESSSFFARLHKRDILIHQPYERFDLVLDFLREAVYDPQVLAIKQTIYRTGSDPQMMDLLREAVRRGKEVMVVVELKARFDEEANINWSEMLESIGAQVVYGVVGLKTHAKMMLITRREGRALRRYMHLSTGNYNPRTARLYTDISHLTADPDLTDDAEQVFLHLASQSKLPRLRKMAVAPFFLHSFLIAKIAVMARAARNGRDARIVLKMNALTDEQLIRSLIEAGRQGVRIDLLVRGACMLPAQVPGHTDNIRVRSVIGRFLEHSRVFYFSTGRDEELYLSSADWMNRNMVRRVEICWPVTDPGLRQRLVDECLLAYLHDGVDAWDMQPDGSYESVSTHRNGKGHSAQQALMMRYGALS